MRPSDFLVLATELAARETESCWRSAVSRAYYAAFHACRDFLNDLGFVIRQGDQAHAAVYRRLSNSNVAEINGIGTALMELRRLRNLADYELRRSFASVTAHKAVQDAQQLFDDLASPRDHSTRSLIAGNIRTYERDVPRDVTWRQV